ncbi:unnamed protein product [Pseudo-nitzschia multistriata]|uniref:Amidohydrolase-related domain-containing protein n=1 Tax=Pseudo-nitzschia multistriata TaxID=183589 RepID=A0A448Z5Y9_9STRA|nr:unnamed protein product [Pseudo-nitzschia multistriata]
MLKGFNLPLILFLGSKFRSTQSFLHSSPSIDSNSYASSTALQMKIIDSHLHVWASSAESATYPYAPEQTPPDSLIDTSSTSSLLDQMSKAGVDGALIVQPINHKYDHRYVTDALKGHPDKFKGILLFDPSESDPDAALARFEELVLQGYVGVRFNPYLFEGKMCENEAAVKIFKRCAELKFPVGIMCFKGIDLHYEDIESLCDTSPETVVVLDHFGFASVENQDQFEKVLSLKNRNTVVKISALFRLGDPGAPKYERVRTERFEPLLEAYGPDRLMFGTDFPFVTQEEIGYQGAVDTVLSWMSSPEEKSAVMGGTAERLFGVWGVN